MERTQVPLSSVLRPSPAPTALAPPGKLQLRHLTGGGLFLQSPGTQHVGLEKSSSVTTRADLTWTLDLDPFILSLLTALI